MTQPVPRGAWPGPAAVSPNGAARTLNRAGLTAERISPSLHLADVNSHPAPVPASPPVAGSNPPDPAEVGHGQPPAARTCPRCGMLCAAAVAHTDGPSVLVESASPGGDLVPVDQHGAWTVRAAHRPDPAPYWQRWTSHTCRRYPYICQAPTHTNRVPARLYPGGAYCDACANAR